jgi:dihydroneopterin aldolase
MGSRERALDIVFVRDLKIETVIGIFEWERHVTQVVTLNLDMASDTQNAAKDDSISRALNYKDVVKRLTESVGSAKFELVETLAESVARIIVQEFQVPWVRVSVAKPGAVQGAREVGVVIERTADAYA